MRYLLFCAFLFLLIVGCRSNRTSLTSDYSADRLYFDSCSTSLQTDEINWLAKSNDITICLTDIELVFGDSSPNSLPENIRSPTAMRIGRADISNRESELSVNNSSTDLNTMSVGVSDESESEYSESNTETLTWWDRHWWKIVICSVIVAIAFLTPWKK